MKLEGALDPRVAYGPWMRPQPFMYKESLASRKEVSATGIGTQFVRDEALSDFTVATPVVEKEMIDLTLMSTHTRQEVVNPIHVRNLLADTPNAKTPSILLKFPPGTTFQLDLSHSNIQL